MTKVASATMGRTFFSAAALRFRASKAESVRTSGFRKILIGKSKTLIGVNVVFGFH